MVSVPRLAPLLLPPIGPIAAGIDFWSDAGVSSILRDVPMAVVVALPFLALPVFFLGLVLAAADYKAPKLRAVWITTEIILALVIFALGLLWLGPEMNF